MGSMGSMGFMGLLDRSTKSLLVFMLDLDHIHVKGYTKTTPLGGEYI